MPPCHEHRHEHRSKHLRGELRNGILDRGQSFLDGWNLRRENHRGDSLKKKNGGTRQKFNIDTKNDHI